MGGSGKKLARSGRTLCSSRVLQTRSGNVFAPDSDFSRRFLAVLLGGSELASRLPNYGSAPGSSNMLRRPISSGSAALEGRLGKAKSSMVASAVPRSCLSVQSVNRAFARFFAHQWRNMLNAHVFFANSGLLGNLFSPHPLAPVTKDALIGSFFFILGEGKKAKRP